MLAVAIEKLRAEAIRLDGVIEVTAQVGDFVAVREPLFYLFGGAVGAIDDALRENIVLGPERTMEQDPTFSFRIIVDIALKALSPAINDPTTAVLAIDQLHRMLRVVGTRHLRADEILGPDDELRVIFRTPNWEDFVHLSLTEIRLCGASNIQIARRIRALVENLTRTLPPHRHRALTDELELLDRDAERYFLNREDLALARVADSQGLGGGAGKTITSATLIERRSHRSKMPDR